MGRMLGFLHTAEAHVATFEALLPPGVTAAHAVEPALLADARAHGVTPELTARIAAGVDGLVARGARVVVCTCSTIGGAAESVPAPVPVLRADRPMAEAAVAAGRRIAVVYAVGSTLGPTRELLASVGADRELIDVPCPGAWESWEAGDLEAYGRKVAGAARLADADVIVLAQASMAPAAALLADLPVPVLVSPPAAVARALTLAGWPDDPAAGVPACGGAPAEDR